MCDRIPIEILEGYRESFSSQEGRKYPCSNQIVVCGIFTSDRDKAINFMKDKDIKEKRERRDEITWYLNNGERWVWKNWNESYRGYRFYKVAVDENVNPRIFEYLILPYTSFYCCSFEII